MKIGDEVYVHGYVDEIRKDMVIIRNEGGYFGTVPSEIKPSDSEKPNNCETCKHNKLEWFSEICDGCSKANSHYEPKDEPQINEADEYWLSLLKDVVDGKLSDAGANQAWYEYINHKDEPQTETEIARAIVHKMIDDAVIAEDAYPDLRQKMHDAVDNYEPQTDCAWGGEDDHRQGRRMDADTP